MIFFKAFMEGLWSGLLAKGRFFMAGILCGSVAAQFKPTLLWPVSLAVFCLFGAYEKMTYKDASE